MSDNQSENSAEWGPALVVSPCLACPTPGQCTDTNRCATPKAGETWHVLRVGATACATLKIAEMTQRTVLFEPVMYGVEGERIPLGMGLCFIERARANGQAQGPSPLSE